MINNNIIIKYFKPKAFEFCGRSSIYIFVGIKSYKRYLPTSGDILFRLMNKKQLHFNNGGRYQELLRYEMQTRRWELRHIIGMVVFILLFLIIKNDYMIYDNLFLTILFLLINVYPIILQRHNRIRIIKLLLKFKQKNPYD